ncbi:MAG: hypothetical protein J5588_10480 [Bacteroidales bacterium]|nr:hypothetical protein [Bacteroidales bacterium]
MKNVFFMTLLAVTSCFAMISCGDDKKDDPKPENNTVVTDEKNPFAGNTYKVVGEGRDEDDYFAFSESKVSWGKDNVFNYTFDETTFTLSRGGYEFIVSYTFSEDKNTLTLSSSAGISGEYVKQ